MEGCWWDWTQARWVRSAPAEAVPEQRAPLGSADDLHGPAEPVALEPALREPLRRP